MYDEFLLYSIVISRGVITNTYGLPFINNSACWALADTPQFRSTQTSYEENLLNWASSEDNWASPEEFWAPLWDNWAYSEEYLAPLWDNWTSSEENWALSSKAKKTCANIESLCGINKSFSINQRPALQGQSGCETSCQNTARKSFSYRESIDVKAVVNHYENSHNYST